MGWTFRSVRSLASPILQNRCPSGCLLLPLRATCYAPLACRVKLHNPVFEELPTGWLEAMLQVRRMLVGLPNAVPERFKSQKSASAHPLHCCSPGMSRPSSSILCEAGHTMSSASRTCQMKLVEVAPDYPMACSATTTFPKQGASTCSSNLCPTGTT